MKNAILISIMFSIFSSPVKAENDKKGLYVGVLYGHSNYSDGSSLFDFDGSALGGGLMLGVHITNTLGIEGTVTRYEADKFDTTIASLSGIYSFSIFENFSLYGKLGVAGFDGAHDEQYLEVDEAGVLAGAGMDYMLSKGFRLRAGYDLVNFHATTGRGAFDLKSGYFNLGVYLQL